MSDLIIERETMSSSQLAEILGYERKEVNKKVRLMFSGEEAREKFSPTLRANDQVIDYFLPEKESKMFVARHDIEYLETVIQFWINKGYQHEEPKTQLQLAREQVVLLERLEQIAIERDAAIATKAEIGGRREATAMNTASQAVKEVKRMKDEQAKERDHCSIKRMQMLYHGQKFKWQLLKRTGIEMNIPSTDVFDENYGTVKAYHRSVWLEAYAVTFES